MTDQKKIRAARNIADHLFALGGPDLRGLSDDELVQHIEGATNRVTEAMRKIGVSADEAAKSLQAFGAALAKSKDSSDI